MATSAQQLLALMQAGDLTALDLLARSCGPRLLAVAKRRCHRLSDAEDAVQQALLTASTDMTSFRGEGSAVAWLSTLVARSCSRFNETHAREVATALPCTGCAEQDLELGEAVGRALMTLSRTDRLAFLMTVEGFDGVEIAEQLGLSHDAVRGRLKRVRKLLRDTLEAAERTDAHDLPAQV